MLLSGDGLGAKMSVSGEVHTDEYCSMSSLQCLCPNSEIQSRCLYRRPSKNHQIGLAQDPIKFTVLPLVPVHVRFYVPSFKVKFIP